MSDGFWLEIEESGHELRDAWAAGVFDGEGSVYLERNCGGYRMTVSIVQSAPRGAPPPLMLSTLRDEHGGSLTKGERPKKTTHRQIWRWVVSARKAERFLNRIVPHVVAKLPQVRLALRSRSLPRRDLGAVCLELRRLKKL
jgi:hypothetical protein